MPKKGPQPAFFTKAGSGTTDNPVCATVFLIKDARNFLRRKYPVGENVRRWPDDMISKLRGMMLTKSRPVTAFGSFGFGNVGDDAVLPSFTRLLQAADPMLAGDVIGVSRFSQALRTDIHYMEDPAALLTQGLISDTVFLIGGGIIEPNRNSCLNRLVDLRRATRPFLIQPFAISCEPGVVFGLRERRRLRTALAHLPEILVRDEISQAALEPFIDLPVRVVGDIVLWLQPGVLPDMPPLPDRYIAVSLASVWEDRAFFDWLAADLAETARRIGAHVLMVPISNAVGKDVGQHRALVDQIRDVHGVPAQLCDFGGDPFPRADWVAEVYDRAELVVASRLHGCVMAYAQKTPFVGIGYHPKLLGFARTVGWEAMLLPRRIPLKQSTGSYGFSLEDVEFCPGELVATAADAMGYRDFSARDFYRMKQMQALRPLLARVTDR